jgi:hypothetical protein
VAEHLGIDAGELAAAPADPSPPAGDLRGELDGFTTLDACVAQHAALDPLVGDAIRAIGYETFLRDACRILDAAKRGDARACDAIDASALRGRCQAVTAMVAGKIEGCPWAMPDDHARGREATCVAVAARDPRLCAGEARNARATCEAIAAHDESRCRLAAGDSRECRREAARWKRVMEPPAGATPAIAPALPKIDAHLTLHGASGTPDPARVENDLTADASRGVVLTASGSVARFDLGSRRELGSTMFTPSALDAARMAATIRVDAKVATLEHLEIDVPGARRLVVPGVRCECRVTLATLERTRGGEVHFLLDGDLGVPPQAYTVHADITTFVRDVVDGPPALAPRSSR